MFDLVLVLIAAPFAVVAMMCTAPMVWIFLGRPVFFRQQRAGKGGRPFMMIKFRSMQDLRDAQGELLPDAERLTRFGRFLRSSSLDELPELWNVLKGEMSWVGPRPLPLPYVNRYSARQKRRLDAVPGITGWAQIQGRNAVPWPQRFEYDVWYVDNCSLWLDLRIMVKTVAAVIFRRGIAAEGEATMQEFMGDAVMDRSAAVDKPVPTRGEPAGPDPAHKNG